MKNPLISLVILLFMTIPAKADIFGKSLNGEERINWLESQLTWAIESEKRLLAGSLVHEMKIYEALSKCECSAVKKLIVNNINGLLILSTYVMEKEYPNNIRLIGVSSLEAFKTFKLRHSEIKWKFLGKNTLVEFLNNLPTRASLNANH